MENAVSESIIPKLLKEASEEGLISSSQMTKASPVSLRASMICPSTSRLRNHFSRTCCKRQLLRMARPFIYQLSRKYKEEIVTIIHEYFLSDDIPELIRSLQDLSLPQYNPVFIKKLITLAMDRKNREKEMASVLLSALSMDFFSTEDIVN
ncbi:hypothetical protein ACMD2_22788, partial [Ananas comosus]